MIKAMMFSIVFAALSCKNADSSKVADAIIEEDPKKSPLEIISMMGYPALASCTLEYVVSQADCTLQFLVNYTYSTDPKKRNLTQIVLPISLRPTKNGEKTVFKEVSSCGNTVGEYSKMSDIVVKCKDNSEHFLMGTYPITNKKT